MELDRAHHWGRDPRPLRRRMVADETGEGSVLPGVRQPRRQLDRRAGSRPPHQRGGQGSFRQSGCSRPCSGCDWNLGSSHGRSLREGGACGLLRVCSLPEQADRLDRFRPERAGFHRWTDAGHGSLPRPGLAVLQRRIPANPATDAGLARAPLTLSNVPTPHMSGKSRDPSLGDTR